jgi:ribosomal protein S18 acetylase RimI-like enzyme
MSTEIRPCRKDDLARIAAIHKSRFLMPGSLLGQLSPALIAALYASFVGRAVFLVHTSDGEIDGFVLGGSSQAMLRCKLSFFGRQALYCLGSVLLRPRLWLLAFRSFVKVVRDWIGLKSAASPSDEFRMLSIAVAKGAIRQGVGTALVQGFDAATPPRYRGYSLYVLKTNAAAIRFYEALGFERRGETEISWKLRKELYPCTTEKELANGSGIEAV